MKTPSARRRKQPTPAELNVQAKKFWDRESARLTRQALTHPNEIKAAADLAARLLQAGHIADPLFVAETSLNAATLKLEKSRKRAATQGRRQAELRHRRDQVARSAAAARRSAEVRRDEREERDRRIRDAINTHRMAPKQVQADQKIRGKKRLSLSQIRRISKG